MGKYILCYACNLVILVVLANAHQRRSAPEELKANSKGRFTVPRGEPPPPLPPVIVPESHSDPGSKDVPTSYEGVGNGNVPVHFSPNAARPRSSIPSVSSGAGIHSVMARRKIEDTQVDCLKTHMLVTFRFNVPFHGYIYPHANFARCLLFTGHNSWKAEILLKHGTCGDKENTIVYHGRTFTDPIIEHRLVIQWDRDIIGEDDTSVIVRCDRPDDYNKTVEWNLEMFDLDSSYESNTHPGPKMWMEIQRGEGPRAPPLNDEAVYVGDLLTLIFTLSDNVYWFDSNILTCYALDGSDQKSQIEWEAGKDVSAAARVFSGEATVIENGCSVKPKLFSHFYKEKDTTKTGDMVTLHYAHFKAFRFPTSMKIVIQCDVQVCYKACEEFPPCSEAFTPRTAAEQSRRRRRAADAPEQAGKGSFDLDRVNLFRSIEVYMPDEPGTEGGLKISAPVRTEELSSCYTSASYFGTVLGLLCVILILIVLLLFMYMKVKIGAPSFFSPNKNKG